MRVPRVSVAICTYQGARWVEDQLRSLLEQTRLPDEVVVSDDGSTDGTLEIVRDLVEGSAVSVRMLQNPGPRGYRRNFERAVEACTGDIIFLADQDDVWLRDKIASMLPSFAEEKVAIVHCDAVLADAELRGGGETVFGRHPGLRPGAARVPPAVRRGLGIPGCTMALRASLVGSLVPFSELWGHDLWISLVGGALGDVVPVPRPLMLYRRHPPGAGPSRYLDAGPGGRAREGMRRRHPEDYERDARKWREVVERLESLRAAITADDPRRPRIEEFLREYRRRADLARFRSEMRGRPRHQRIAPVARRVAVGDYRRYLRPVASPLKDVLL